MIVESYRYMNNESYRYIPRWTIRTYVAYRVIWRCNFYLARFMSSVARYWSLDLPHRRARYHEACVRRSLAIRITARWKQTADLYSPPAYIFALTSTTRHRARSKGEKFRNGPKNAAVVNPLAKQFLIGAAKQMKLEENLTPAKRVTCRYKK